MARNPLERLVHVSLQKWTSSPTVLTLYFTDFITMEVRFVLG